MNKDELHNKVRSFFVPIAKKLYWINPNAITLSGLLFALLAGLLFAFGEIIYATVFVLISGFFDLLDGAVAKANNKKTEFGGILDSVCDRYADTTIIIGIMWGYSFNNNALWFLIGTSAIVGSIMVGYTRAKGEKVISEKITIGIADRPTRIGLIVIGAILGCINCAILLIAILSTITVLQRLQFIRKKLK